MTERELETWKRERVMEVHKLIFRMTDEQHKAHLLDIASHIICFAADAGATDWPAELHLADVIDKHIRRSPTLMDATDGHGR